MKTLETRAWSLCPKTKTIFARVLRCLLPFTLAAVAQAQFIFGVTNGIITIGGYSGPAGRVTIPDTIDGLPVRVVGPTAFYYRNNLTSISIPGSVTNIGNSSFQACSGLTNISVDAANPVYSSLNGVLFDKAQTKLIKFPEAQSGSYIIPENVISIGYAALSSCTGLTSVTMPPNLTTIGSSAFSGCSGLSSITIPESVVSLGGDAFSGCSGFNSVTIPNRITNINNLTFANCHGLTNATIGNGVTSIGFAAFLSCTNLSTVTIPNSVTNIEPSAFSECTGLTRVTIGSGVTMIGNEAFAACLSLKGIYFAGNAPDLDRSPFKDSDQTTVYYLPGTAGWEPTFGSRPTAVWSLSKPVILSNNRGFGSTAEGFGFIVSWATNGVVVVEASPDLATPVWSPVSTNLLSAGSTQFTDPQWTNQPARLYRLRIP